jgi:hypothetical protein
MKQFFIDIWEAIKLVQQARADAVARGYCWD